MLTLESKAQSGHAFCDRLSRRNFLAVGGMACGGLSLESVLRAEAAQPGGSSHKGLINIFLPGGPPHQDMWDLKPDAPTEVRGEFKPISTNVAGIQIGELLPGLASIMDKLVILRSIVGAKGPHYARQCMCPQISPESPSLGAWVSKLKGPVHPSMPPNLSLFYRTQYREWGEPGHGGFLGEPHAPLGLVDKYAPGHKADSPAGLSPDPGRLIVQDISIQRLRDRRSLLSLLNTWQKHVEASPSLGDRNSFTQQAWEILSSPRLVEALDISHEDPKVIERYGEGSAQYNGDSAPRISRNLLIARRLIEAGARVVSLNFSRWDWHGRNFEQSRTEFPRLDQAVTALVKDLDERGMLNDVSVIVWGEFGRTPKINKDAGRDHWTRVNSALLAGGGMRTGQVLGATDKIAGEVIDRPITFGDVHATLLHNLGIDPHVSVPDRQGRTRRPTGIYATPIAELI